MCPLHQQISFDDCVTYHVFDFLADLNGTVIPILLLIKISKKLRVFEHTVIMRMDWHQTRFGSPGQFLERLGTSKGKVWSSNAADFKPVKKVGRYG